MVLKITMKIIKISKILRMLVAEGMKDVMLEIVDKIEEMNNNEDN